MAAPINPVATLGLDESKLQRLATELAREMYEPQDILKMFAVSADDVGHLLEQSVTFQQMYREAYQLWHSSGGIRDRIEAKALIVYEQSLEQLDKDLHDTSHPLSARVDLAKHLAATARLVQKDGAGQAQIGDKVVLNIYFKGQPLQLAKEISVVGTPQFEPPDVDTRDTSPVTTVVT
jgi:hypothetical protein